MEEKLASMEQPRLLKRHVSTASVASTIRKDVELCKHEGMVFMDDVGGHRQVPCYTYF